MKHHVDFFLIENEKGIIPTSFPHNELNRLILNCSIKMELTHKLEVTQKLFAIFSFRSFQLLIYLGTTHSVLNLYTLDKSIGKIMMLTNTGSAI